MDEGERRALLDAWFRAYGDRVFAYLLHRTDRETAQDLVQEVIAFRKAAAVPDPPIGWLFATARRLLANRYRGRRRQDQLIARVADDAAQRPDQEGAEVRRAFAETLAALSANDREVLTLSGWYGLSPGEAAQALGCSSSTYAVRLHRARQRLAAHLESAGYRGLNPAGQLSEALRG